VQKCVPSWLPSVENSAPTTADPALGVSVASAVMVMAGAATAIGHITATAVMMRVTGAAIHAARVRRTRCPVARFPCQCIRFT
jgi:hypothetical protein